MLKPGELAVIKTTEEVVFVLDVEAKTSPQWPGLSGTEVVVRRPVATADKGVYHTVERFQADELETPEEKHKRNAKEYSKFKKIARDSAAEVLSETTPEGELLN